MRTIDHTIVNIIDNSTTEEQGYRKGYTELYQQTKPNQGLVLESDKFAKGSMIFYYEMGAKRVADGQCLLENSAIFMCNGSLVQPGLVCYKRKFDPSDCGLTVKDQIEYFQIVLTNLDTYNRSDIITIQSGQAHRFNAYSRECFFVLEDAVTLRIRPGVVLPGRCFELLEAGDEFYGVKDSCKYYFSKPPEYEFNFQGKPMVLFRKDKLFGIEKVC